jgi:hypothetical protein
VNEADDQYTSGACAGTLVKSALSLARSLIPHVDAHYSSWQGLRIGTVRGSRLSELTPHTATTTDSLVVTECEYQSVCSIGGPASGCSSSMNRSQHPGSWALGSAGADQYYILALHIMMQLRL